MKAKTSPTLKPKTPTKTAEKITPCTVYRITFARDVRAKRKPIPPPLFIRVVLGNSQDLIRVSDDQKKWSPTRWQTADMREDVLRLVMLVINDIPEPRTLAQLHQRIGLSWVELTRKMPEKEAKSRMRQAMAP